MNRSNQTTILGAQKSDARRVVDLQKVDALGAPDVQILIHAL